MNWFRFTTALRFYPKCLIGLHVPVRIDYPDGLKEYCCQNCAKQMKPKQWEQYFKNRKHLIRDE